MKSPAEYRVDDLAQLQRVLDNLGLPGPGTKRVYRGQIQQYYNKSGEPSLLPSSFRQMVPDLLDPDWAFITTVLASALDLPEGGGSNTYFVWVPALLQHYGARSDYVDVTTDPFTALWFALHHRHDSTIQRQIALDESTGIPERHAVAWYAPLSVSEARENSPVI